MLEFVFGAVIGHVYAKGHLDRLGAAVGWSLMAVGAAVAVLATAFILPVHPLFDFGDAAIRVTTYGVAGSLVVTGALAWEAARGWAMPSLIQRFWTLVGDASYSLYLTHLITLGLLRGIWLNLGLGTVGWLHTLLFVGTGLVASIALSLPAYLLLEQPLTRTAQKMVREWRLALK